VDSEVERTIRNLEARIRELETRLVSQGLRVSNKDGQTKLVRLSRDGKGLEVE